MSTQFQDVVRNAESAEKYGKEKLYLGWNSLGRDVGDGINDDLVFDDISSAGSTIGINGNFVIRNDQHTHITALSDGLSIDWKSASGVSTVSVEVNTHAVVAAGTPFSINVTENTKLSVLNRRTFGVGNLPKPIIDKNRLPSNFAAQAISIVAPSETGAVLTTKRNGNNATGLNNEDVPPVDFNSFPGSTTTVKNVGVLENTFNMSWQEIDGATQVHFVGTGGVLNGGEGNPGVVLVENKEIHINLLQKRVDGSFFLDADADFLMVTAESLENGDPDVKTLKAAVFPKTGVKLPIGFWHSVPIPVVGNPKLHLIELVSNTNANCVINVNEEIGKPLRVIL